MTSPSIVQIYPSILFALSIFPFCIASRIEEDEYTSLENKNKEFLEKQENFFIEFMKLSFKGQKEVLRSQETISLLAEQTNLILEYDFLLDKVNYYKQNIIKQ